MDWEDPLEKEMATHSSILTWEIPWTEEPGGLQSWGCKESDATNYHYRYRCPPQATANPAVNTKTSGVFSVMLFNVGWKKLLLSQFLFVILPRVPDTEITKEKLNKR